MRRRRDGFAAESAAARDAEALAAQGLLAADDLAAIRDRLAALADEHARGLWRIELADEDVHTALDDDAGIEACLRRVDRNPLGSAAGYGTPGLPLDREATRAEPDC